MPERFNQIAFAFEILKHLAERPHKREQLSSHLSEYLAAQGHTVEDISQKLSRMISKLRDCGFEIRSAPNRPYELIHSNFPVILSSEQREALAMAAYFLSDMGFSQQASSVLQIANLDKPLRPNTVRVNFSPPADYSEERLNAIVATLQDRFRQRRRYTIRYRSSQGNENNWDLDRSELRLHNGVLYLFAHAPDFFVRHHPVEKNQIFRVDRILSIGAASEIPWGILEFPRISICYRMSGPLATYQPRRNHERVVDRAEDNSWVRIEAQEDYLFWFRQRILQYGASVKLLSPSWLVEQIAQELSRASDCYK